MDLNNMKNTPMGGGHNRSNHQKIAKKSDRKVGRTGKKDIQNHSFYPPFFVSQFCWLADGQKKGEGGLQKGG